MPGMVAHIFNSRTVEAEARGSTSSRLGWSIEQVSGQLGMQRETLSQKNHLAMCDALEFIY